MNDPRKRTWAEISLENIAHNVKAMREKRGMTRKAMADAIGAEISTYRQWEQMRFFPNSRWLPMIAEVLECRISDLY